MEIQVREALIGDAPTIARFNLALAEESEKKTLDEVVVTEGVKRGLSERNHVTYMVAQSGELLLGQLMVTREWSDWRNGWFWWIQSVYVDSKFRGKGVFKALLNQTKLQAEQSQDVIGLRLYVHDENESAIKTYLKQGIHATDYRIMEMSL